MGNSTRNDGNWSWNIHQDFPATDEPWRGNQQGYSSRMKLGEIMGRTPGDYMGTILMRTIELEHGDIFVASSYV